jgi:hydrogenase maturation protease
MLIIGCGNRDRGDDAAGLLVAERLREIGIPATICSGEASDLIELWRGLDDVIVIDAVLTYVEPGTIQCFESERIPDCGKLSSSTHGMGLAEAVQLARNLACLPVHLRVYGIEGRRFEIGAELSEGVRKSVEDLARRISAQINSGDGVPNREPETVSPP